MFQVFQLKLTPHRYPLEPSLQPLALFFLSQDCFVAIDRLSAPPVDGPCKCNTPFWWYVLYYPYAHPPVSLVYGIILEA